MQPVSLKEVNKSVRRLSEVRSVESFSAETQIDPTADIQGQVSLVNTLQQQLYEALIEHDLLKDITSEAILDLTRQRGELR